MNTEEISFQLILHGGNAKSCAMEAIYLAKESKFEEADKKFQEAKESLNEAHGVQTSIIQGEARGEKTEICLLLIHAQDHLMNAITTLDLAKEVVALYKKIDK